MTTSVANPYYEGVKVPSKIVRKVREIVSDGFYQKSMLLQENDLVKLNSFIAQHYNISVPQLVIDTNEPESYNPATKTITLPKSSSIISYLHEMRHHLQHTAGKRYNGHGIEEDARAWSLRIFKKACPGSFKRSLARGEIMHIYLDPDTGEVRNMIE